MISLSRYLQDKDQLSGVVMIRLAYNGKSYDYSAWKFSENNVFLFDEDMRIGHILCKDDTITIVDEIKFILSMVTNSGIKRMIVIELFYGGVII